jgi:hypothetical protein
MAYGPLRERPHAGGPFAIGELRTFKFLKVELLHFQKLIFQMENGETQICVSE